MKLNQLRDLVAIVERGSLRGAARYLNVAQSGLTRSIRNLERELGHPMFEREAHGLNAYGSAFLPEGQFGDQRAQKS